MKINLFFGNSQYRKPFTHCRVGFDDYGEIISTLSINGRRGFLTSPDQCVELIQ